jgi:hypothetical protein
VTRREEQIYINKKKRKKVEKRMLPPKKSPENPFQQQAGRNPKKCTSILTFFYKLSLEK